MAEVAITKNRQDLERLEGIIERNLHSFFEVGRALMEIRAKNYYRDVLGFETFEAYCKAKWDFNRAHAYRLIDSAKVIDVLSPIGDTKPMTESQARPLVKLKDNPEAQREAWQKAVETAPEGKVTAAHVHKVVKKYRLEGAGETIEKTGAGKTEPEDDLPDDGLRLCDKAIAQMAKIRKTDIYREKAFDRMQTWLDENRLPTADKIQKIRDLEDGIAKASAGELERLPTEPGLPLPQVESKETNPEVQGNRKTNEGIAGEDMVHHETAGEPLDIDVRKNKTYSQCSLAIE